MNEVIDLLFSLVQDISKDIDHMSDEEFDESIKFILEAIEVIKQEEEPILTPKENLPAADFPSSNVNGFMYNPDTEELQVQFHGPYPDAAGSIYSYKNVPKYIYDVFSRGGVGPKTSGKNSYHAWNRGVTPSLGGSLNALLKAGGFSFEKLS
jgi:hypothetical protein